MVLVFEIVHVAPSALVISVFLLPPLGLIQVDQLSAVLDNKIALVKLARRNHAAPLVLEDAHLQAFFRALPQQLLEVLLPLLQHRPLGLAHRSPHLEELGELVVGDAVLRSRSSEIRMMVLWRMGGSVLRLWFWFRVDQLDAVWCRWSGRKTKAYWRFELWNKTVATQFYV